MVIFFKRFGEKVESCEKDLLAIVQIQVRPPHYVVQVTLIHSSDSCPHYIVHVDC